MFFFLILFAVVENGPMYQLDFYTVIAILAMIGAALLGIGFITNSRTSSQNHTETEQNRMSAFILLIY